MLAFILMGLLAVVLFVVGVPLVFWTLSMETLGARSAALMSATG